MKTHLNWIASAALAICLAGCGNGEEVVIDNVPPELPGGHAHPEQGPHGGELIKLGKDEFHAEMVSDEKSNKVTVYLLDAPARDEVAIADDAININAVLDGKPKQFALAAVRADGKAETAQFELTDEHLIKAIHAGHEARCRLNVTINKTPYVGKIDHHHHGHDHDHSHDHGHDHKH